MEKISNSATVTIEILKHGYLVTYSQDGLEDVHEGYSDLKDLLDAFRHTLPAFKYGE